MWICLVSSICRIYYSLQTCKVLLLPYWYVVSSEELPALEALLSNGVDYSLQWTLICFGCFLSWVMRSAGCASGSADLRKGKNCWAAAAGRGVRKMWVSGPAASKVSTEGGREALRAWSRSCLQSRRGPWRRRLSLCSLQALCRADLHVQPWRSLRWSRKSRGAAAHEGHSWRVGTLVWICVGAVLEELQSVGNSTGISLGCHPVGETPCTLRTVKKKWSIMDWPWPHSFFPSTVWDEEA